MGLAPKCICYSPSGDKLAVGCAHGVVCILDPVTLAELATVNHRASDIVDIKFCPDGCSLAVASNTSIDLYELQPSVLKRTGVCKSNSSILRIDWSSNGQNIRSMSATTELTYWCIIGSPSATGYPSADSVEIEEHEWHTMTCMHSSCVPAVPASEGALLEVQCCSAANSTSIIAAGVTSQVRLFNYPCAQKERGHNAQQGHISGAARIQWSHDDAHLVTVGSSDLSVFQWKLVPKDCQPQNLEGNLTTVSSEHIAFASRVDAATHIQRQFRHHLVHKEIAALDNRRKWLLASLQSSSS